MSDHFLGHLPISYILTVRSAYPSGNILTRGIFAGDDQECYLIYFVSRPAQGLRADINTFNKSESDD